MGLHHRALSLRISRRHLLQASAGMTLGSLVPTADGHNAAGEVNPPEAPPPVSLSFHDGTTGTLQQTLVTRASALQLMFTTCRATCPIQGALFAEVAKQLGDRLPPAQLLSISIDPARDTPEALRAWLGRFGASPRWRAARPDSKQLEALATFLKSRTKGPDPHTGQVYFFNRVGELVLRSVDFPPPAEVVRVLARIVTRS